MSLLSLPTLEDRAERSPSSSRARTIGVLNLDPSSYGKASVLSGIHPVTREHDYCVSIVSLRERTRTSLLDALGRLRHLAVDGILVLAPRQAEIELLAETPLEVPLVILGAPHQEALSAVSSDHYAGAASATRHLLDLGHRKVFHIAAPADAPEPGSRMAGWRDTLRAAGADVPAPMIGDGTPGRGYALGRELAGRPDVTAIFVAGDQMALGVLRALFEAGRRVPQEVSVVGFGGMPEAEFFNPPLTTVRQNLTQMGRRGAELLHVEIQAGESARVHETIPADLVLRASTAAVA